MGYKCIEVDNILWASRPTKQPVGKRKMKANLFIFTELKTSILQVLCSPSQGI
jgi:hypothetical protein